MFDIYAALSGGMIANLLLTILGLVISVAAGILLYWKVFGPKAKDPSAGKFMQYANGQRFLPLYIVKITYYSLAAFLVFIGIAKCITTIDGFGAIFKYVIVGNVVLRILFETVVDIKKPKQDFYLEPDAENLDGLNFLTNQNMSVVNRKALEGVILAHTDGGVPNMILEVEDVSEKSLGYLIYFFEKACAISGYLLGVNPFNQPGVESYKKNMFALLGKPGYEDQKAALEAKLAE